MSNQDDDPLAGLSDSGKRLVTMAMLGKFYHEAVEQKGSPKKRKSKTWRGRKH